MRNKHLFRAADGSDDGDGWTTKQNKMCASNHRLKTVTMTDLDAAKEACTKNRKCKGVYDSGCDESGASSLPSGMTRTVPHQR